MRQVLLLGVLVQISQQCLKIAPTVPSEVAVLPKGSAMANKNGPVPSKLNAGRSQSFNVLQITTTPPRCSAPPPGGVGLFVANNVDTVTVTDFDFGFNGNGGQSLPAAAQPCMCSSVGQKHYFTSPNIADWTDLQVKNQQIAKLTCNSKGRLNICACVSPTECYRPSNTGMDITLAAYCVTPASCAIYMLIGGLDTDSMIPTGRGTQIVVRSQFHPNRTAMDIRDSHPTITAIGCGGCPIATDFC